MRGDVKPRLLLIMCAHTAAAVLTGMVAGFAPSALLAFYLLRLMRMPSGNIVLYVPVCSFFLLLTGAVVLVICERTRGAPLKPGDQVVILSGAYKGRTAEVSRTILQNSGIEVILDLGPQGEQGFHQSSLLKMRRKQQ